MCIRDSAYTGGVVSAPDDADEESEEVVETETISGAITAMAVSYTHLRAHETVLDLVCRLLLEKKTYNKICHDTLETNTTTTHEITLMNEIY